jgi:hypothetical protein
MEEQNIQEFQWASEEIEKLYKMVNKIYSVILMNRFPYIKRLEIDKESFNNVFTKEEDSFFSYDDVDVHMCADFMSPEYRNDEQMEKEKKRGGIGDTMGKIWKDTFLLTGTNLLNKRKLYPRLVLNKSSFCKDYQEFTVDD